MTADAESILDGLASSGRLAELRAAARRHADHFQLPLRHHNWRGQSGDFTGASVGSSLDFHDHRGYLPGDDPRHINWQAYARTGNYTMKQYREEVRPLVDVIFDVSGSMFFEKEKAERAIELFYFLVEGAWHEAASLAVYLVQGDAFFRLSDDALHGETWLRDREQQLDPAGLADPPAVWKIPLRANALRIFLSDLLFPGHVEEILGSLAQRQGRPMTLAPFTESEADVDWNGNHEFVDAELSTHHIRRVDDRLLKRYHTAYERHFDYWRILSQKHGALCCRVPCANNFEEAIRLEAVSAGAIEFGAT